MMEYNVLYAILIAVGVVVFMRVILPYMRKNNLDFYNEVKLFLLISGYSFRDEKIKAISAMALEVVKEMEKLGLAAEEKHYAAVDEVFRRLLIEFGIELEEEIIETIIMIAVSQLPPTQKEVA
jgi:hypothetical protein